MTPRHLLAPARLAGSRLLATQSDERLVDLLRAGSEPAFEAIVSRYRGPLLRYCSALLGSERAEDAVQQTFVKAYDAMHRDDRPLLLKPWLYRIAHNTAHNALRDNARRDELLGDGGAVADRPETVVERREQLRSVLASVQELPPRQRDALVLRELEGRSYEEIATALGVGGGAVRQLLNRARTAVRTAATAITPVGLLLRLPTAGSGAGESVAARVAEMTGAAGAGAVVSKVAATALVTGAVAGGAAVAPLGDSDGTPAPRGGAAEAREDRDGRVLSPEPPATIAPGSMEPASSGAPPSEVSRGGDDSSGPGSGRGGPDRGGRGDSSGPGGGSGSSGSSGPGGGGSGSGDGTSGSNSGPGSDSFGSGSGPGTSGSGSGSGTSGSGSGSSGSVSSESGSGSSGSGFGSSSAALPPADSLSSGSGSGSSSAALPPADSSSSGSGSGSDTSGSGSGQ